MKPLKESYVECLLVPAFCFSYQQTLLWLSYQKKTLNSHYPQ